jgi:glutamate-1-semialdehyde 2,1-aminomutase
MVKKATAAPAADALFGFDGHEDWRKMLHERIPGGAHTYSKGDDQFPADAPPALERGEGAWTFAPGGAKYLDMAMGLRSVTLGHCYPAVVEAVAESLKVGNNFSRPSIYEAKYAENLVRVLRWPDMVKFCKNGSTATSAAVKLARAHTGRALVARCRQQPFFSYDDWFIGSTACPRGVPDEVAKLTVQFDYDSLESVDRLLAEHPGKISCLILEPATDRPPSRGFLEGLRERCTKHEVVLIFDEMILGFRLALGGGGERYGVEPDLATFGKGMANGFSMAALVGKRAIMEQGDITEGRRKVFLVSTTHGAEICTIFAAQAALNVYRRKDVIGALGAFGSRLKTEFNEASRRLGLLENIRMDGFDVMPSLLLARGGKPDPELRTLFMQEMLKGGVLIPYLAPSLSHGKPELEALLEAFAKAGRVLARALKENSLRSLINGPVVKPVFREIN